MRQDKTANGHLDDSYLVFVEWLTAKAKEGTLNWDNHANVIGAKLRSTVAEFSTFEDRNDRPEWSVFTVHDAHAELMRISPRVSDKSPLVRALDNLFAVVVKSGPAKKPSFWRHFAFVRSAR